MNNRFVKLFTLACSLVGLSGPTAFGHNTPGSVVQLDFHRDGVLAELILPLEELQISFRQPILAETNAILSKHQAALKDYIAAHVNPETSDGRKWTVAVQSLETQLEKPPFDLIARVWMQPPPNASSRQFIFNYSVINHEVMSHNAFVSVRNDWDTAVFSGKPEPLGHLQFTITALTVDRTHGNWWQGFRSVMNVGVHHIAEGTDHLLFLLVLLLPAPLLATGKRWGDFGGLRRSLMQLLKIVSAFTIGHSLTLLIGALGWLQLPSQPVEILIAFSIFVSALHAIRPWFAGREVYIAAGFGLVHGLAFAGSIAEYGFSPWYLAATVLGFNLGIELMQLIVVALTIPWLILLARTKFYSAVRIGGAVFGAVAALGWIGERALYIRNPMEPLVSTLAHHPLLLVSTLAAAALLATLWHKFQKPAPVTMRGFGGVGLGLILVIFSNSSSPAQTNTGAVVTAANAFLATLNPTQSNQTVYAATLANSWNWASVPEDEATRNGIRFADLTNPQQLAALTVVEAALSASGTNLYDEIRLMATYLNQNIDAVKYNADKYYFAFIGAPSTNSPWLLQLSGHHIAYNLSYNAPYLSGTPMFAGTEPNNYTNAETFHDPLAAQYQAVSTLRATLTPSAQLANSYSEILFGALDQNGHDTIQPKPYPTNGRGQLYSTLSTNQQALVRAFIEAYVNNLPADIAASLLADYLSSAALAQTYIGYSGNSTNITTLGSYFRVDGPRVWIEYIFRAGVAYPGVAHQHSVWRDKLTDYGAAFGTNAIATANRPPTITSNPTNRTNEVATSTTFTVAATGTGPLFYQWQKNASPIPNATNAAYTITSVTNSDAAAYRCQVWNFMGYRTSTAATLTVPTTNAPTIASSAYANGIFQLQVAGDVGPNYIIQSSTNLSDWESLYTTNPAVMPFNWIDPNASNFPARFFRVNYNP